MHLEHKKSHTYLFAFTTTMLLILLIIFKFGNKNKILPFRNFAWITKIASILDVVLYLERLNKYLIFLLLFYLSKIEIWHNISDLWFKISYVKIQLK